MNFCQEYSDCNGYCPDKWRTYSVLTSDDFPRHTVTVKPVCQDRSIFSAGELRQSDT